MSIPTPSAPLTKSVTIGEYSTIVLPNGMIETMFFPADGGNAITVGRTSVRSVMLDHIHQWEKE